MLILDTLYNTILEAEAGSAETVDLKNTLVTLIDAYLQQRSELSDIQRAELARLRASIIIGLANF